MLTLSDEAAAVDLVRVELTHGASPWEVFGASLSPDGGQVQRWLPDDALGAVTLVRTQSIVLTEGAPSVDALMGVGDGHFGELDRFIATSVHTP